MAKIESTSKWSQVTESETLLIVPSNSLKLKEPPKFPAFFNPAAKFNRDVSILIYKNFLNQSKKYNSFVDSMCGLGSRGLRVGKEIPYVNEVLLNDFNFLSIQTAKINAVVNDIYYKCRFYNKETCNFLSENFKFENRGTIIDLDPFGTPSPYLDCILRAVENEGMISVTATDTAVLLGVYPKVCYRKYYGVPLRTKYSLEVGTRLLLSSVALTASRLDLYIYPLFAHSYRNYIRIYCKVVKSNNLANKISEKLGYILHCFNCGYRELLREYQIQTVCPICLKKLRIGGPLWISKIFDKELINKILNEILQIEKNNEISKVSSYSNFDQSKRFFTVTKEEKDEIPFHYLSEEFGRLMKCSTASIHKIIDILKINGYNSSQTVFSSTGFKTDATMIEIRNILNTL